ncbi:MAG: hypothetical protein IKP88_21130 [Lachnospiraceae bacterium]|nr:hypothetical protein [Lachnospiraceae bacterium]
MKKNGDEMLNFYLPDLFNNAPLICFLDDLVKHIPDWFYEDVRIGAAYGSFPGAIWNGGRVVLGSIKKKEMESMIKEYNDRDIAVRYTFTNPLIEEKHLGDTYCNLCLERANNGKNEVIVNSPVLEAYIRDKYPGMKLISSTTKCMEDLDTIREELKKDYYLVVTDSSLNNTDELFSLEPKEKIEVIVNHYCQDHCPRRRAHYNAIGKAQLEFADLDFPECKYTARSFYQIMDNHSFITTDMIFGKYREAGFRHFKVDGRAHGVRNVVDSFLYYLAKPEHRDKVRLIIYKEIYKL